MNGSTPIAWPLRAWFAVELFFAVAASLSVGFDPADSRRNFAWTIQPAVMAALFGAFYLALLPVMVLLLRVRQWELARVFVLPGMAFTAAQLIVTLLHWERFAVGTGPFNIWFASYLLPPPVFAACWVWQQRRAAPSLPPEAPLARWQRWGLLLLGTLFTLEALIGLVSPAWFAADAPWKISPLNARALAGYFLLLGLLMLSMAHENHLDRVRVVSPFLVLLLPLAAWQLSRFQAQVNWGHPRVAMSTVLLTAVAGLGLSLLRGSWPLLWRAAGPAPTGIERLPPLPPRAAVP
jgi:hypothetical protein